MKLDTPDLDKHHLLQTLHAAYGLDVTTLTFMPKGEDAYAYLAHARDGSRYFMRAQHSSRLAADLEHVYAVTHMMHAHSDLRQVLAPYPTARGTFTVRIGEYTVALFPFVDGDTLYNRGTTDVDIIEAASLLAAVHRRGTPLVPPTLRRETFENPFSAPILHALDAANRRLPDSNPYRRQVHELLLAEQTDILATLDHMDRLGLRVQALDFDWVLTHGDPNLDNFLKDPDGLLHLTDWGELALGPPERDLFAFTGEQFALFLRHYVAATGTRTCHLDLFAFYFYRWALQEIADYTTRILFRNLDPLEDEHAWQSLQPYLPIRHAQIAHGTDEVQAVLRMI